MKDRILSNYIKDFLNQFSLGNMKDPEAFEQLVSFCVVSKYDPENFEPADVAIRR